MLYRSYDTNGSRHSNRDMFTFICFINNAYSLLRCFSSSNDTELFPKRFAHFINSTSFCRKLLRYYVLCKCETPIESPMNRFKISTCKSIMKTEKKKLIIIIRKYIRIVQFIFSLMDRVIFTRLIFMLIALLQ